MARSRNHVDRRRFLKGAAVGAAAIVSKPVTGAAQQQAAPAARATTRRSVAGARRCETTAAPRVDVHTTDRPGRTSWSTSSSRSTSTTCAANPGSTFRGLHGVARSTTAATTSRSCSPAATKKSSVAMAHGYAKIEGKPIMVHGARHRRPAARVDGDLQRLCRPRAGLHRPRQCRSTVQCAAQRCRMDARACRTRRRWSATYTKWDDAPISLEAVRRVGRARLQDRDDAADGADLCWLPTRVPSGRAGFAEDRSACGSEAHRDGAAGGRSGARRRNRQDCSSPRRTRSSSPGRLGADAEGHWSCWSSSAELCRRACRSPDADELPTRHPLYDDGQPRLLPTSCSALEVPDLLPRDACVDPVNRMGMESAPAHESRRRDSSRSHRSTS